MLNLLVPIAHCLVVSVLYATLNVAEKETLTPFDEPLARWVSWLHFRSDNRGYYLLLSNLYSLLLNLLLVVRSLILLLLSL